MTLEIAQFGLMASVGGWLPTSVAFHRPAHQNGMEEGDEVPLRWTLVMRTRRPQNTSGDWYVDTTCTNCGAAQTVAPGLIVERDGQSVFLHQPETQEELRQAWRARILCPSASVRTENHTKLAHPVFPEEMTERVYRLGYNAAPKVRIAPIVDVKLAKSSCVGLPARERLC